MLPNNPHPAILHIWRIALCAITLIPAFLTSLLLRIGSLLWIFATCAWAVLFLLAYLVYLPLRYRSLSFGLAGEKIVLSGGVFIKRLDSIPISAVRFTTLTQSWPGALFGLTTLFVGAAGGHIRIPGVKNNDANALAELLNNNAEAERR